MLPAFLISLCFSFGSSDSNPLVVRQVKVEGNRTVAALTILRAIDIMPGTVIEEELLREGIESLHRMGYFQYIEVELREVSRRRCDILFRVEERSRITSFKLAGVSHTCEAAIRRMLSKKGLEFVPAMHFDPLMGTRAALAVRRMLQSQCYPLARAELETSTSETGVDLLLRIKLGPKLRIGSVRFIGNNAVPEEELLKQLQRSRPRGFLDFWTGRGVLRPEVLEGDLRKLKEYYRSRGHADVVLGNPVIWVENGEQGRWDLLSRLRGREQSISIEIPITEGPKFRLHSVRLAGDAKRAADDLLSLIGETPVPSDYDSSRLERVKEEMLRISGDHGYGFARIDLEQSVDSERQVVNAVFRIDAGYPVIIRRIHLSGNDRIPEEFLRQELTIQEGEVYRTSKLDESVRRLNRSGLVEEISREDVLLQPGKDPGTIEVHIEIKEASRQGIFMTGGDRDIGGPYIGILYSVFNLLGLGERISMELDGGAGHSNLLLNFVGRRFLGTPFTIALSGFSRMTNVRLAGIVPDLEDVAELFSPRSKGAGLSGSYALSSRIDAGVNLNLQRTTLSKPDIPDQASSATATAEIAPFFTFDSTVGMDSHKRGQALWFRHGWIGESLVRSPRSFEESFQYSRYLDDPWSSGRNTLAFGIRGAFIRNKQDSPFPLAERLFPGRETVRGFGTGGLTPRVSDSNAMHTAGADSVLGFTSEYRVPIGERLSGAAFLDIGWSHLDTGRGAELGEGLKMVAATNNVLRASVGGELRLQLPFIHQPGRLIFAWNPMRLDRVVRSESGLIRLADPKSSVRFALGGIF